MADADQIDRLFDGWDAFAHPDWDGEGAEPVTARLVAQAKTLALAEPGLPEVGPGADGSVCMEWDHVWIDVEADGRVRRHVPLRYSRAVTQEPSS